MLLILIKNVRVFWVSRCIKNFLRVPTQSLGSLELLITCVAQYSQKNPFKFHNYSYQPFWAIFGGSSELVTDGRAYGRKYGRTHPL